MTLLFSLLALYVLWVMFLAAMNLERARRAGMLSRPARALGIPLVLLTGAIDVAINWTIGTLVLLDRPREATLSQRLSRLGRGTGWRRATARWVCVNLLDAFDPSGSHCGCNE